MSESETPDATEEEQPEETEDVPEIDPSATPEEVEEAVGIEDFIGGGGIKDLLLRTTFRNEETGHEYSQAHLVADVINVMRMDAKQLCRLHGIDVEMEKMTPERAASLLADVAKNDGVGIIEVFEAIEDKQDHIFQQEMSDEHYEQYQQVKQGMLYTVPEGGGA